MSPTLPPTRQLARRLIDGDRAEGSASPDAAHSAADAFERLYQALARWVGLDGSHALFMRALAQARAEHSLLGTIQFHARSTPYLEGVTETIHQHGGQETADALESMLVILIELLGRLIGDDMARNLIERGLGEYPGDGVNRESRRAEA
jgi:hypothetical protein